MKKFFLTLLILIIIGGAGFFAGWVQFAVPPGSVGVITSKTHGVDPILVRPGEFRWLWHRLIPTNTHIAVFRPEPFSHTINFRSTLPSGDSYAAFAGLGADFSWELSAAMSFNIEPDSLVNLVYMHNFAGQDDLLLFMQNTARNIENIILRTFSRIESGENVEAENNRLENLLLGNPDTELEREIAARHPEIHNFTLTVQTARFPDFVLYRQVRQLYEEFLSRQREIIAAGFAERAEGHIAAHLHFDELARYGELLTAFLILLEFMKLDPPRGLRQ